MRKLSFENVPAMRLARIILVGLSVMASPP